MNKKGFTLIEVIVSIVLVSVVLTSMLASLVKLKSSYEVVSENTDALIFSSSLVRIINNDFANNGGIRYIDCTYYGDVCDITLNNNKKRKIQIKPVQTGLTWAQHLEQYISQNGGSINNDKKMNFFKNIVIKVVKDGSTSYHSLADYYRTEAVPADADRIKNLIVGSGTSGIFSSQYCEKIDSGLDSYLSGMCTVTYNAGVPSASCDCSIQELSTSLVYSDVTDGAYNNIYVKTLSLTKEKDLYYKNGAEIRPSTGKERTNGYIFGKLSYTNLNYKNTSRKDLGDFTDTISFISIEINDGINVDDTSYNINLSSSATFPTDSTQVGDMICFDFINFGYGDKVVSSTLHPIDYFCIRYGVNFSIKKDSYYTKIDKFVVDSCTNSVDKPDDLRGVCHTPTIVDSGVNYVFGGYYYDKDGNDTTHDDKIKVIDKDGNILITTTYFDTSIKSSNPRLYVKWCSPGDTTCLN